MRTLNVAGRGSPPGSSLMYCVQSPTDMVEGQSNSPKTNTGNTSPAPGHCSKILLLLGRTLPSPVFARLYQYKASARSIRYLCSIRMLIEGVTPWIEQVQTLNNEPGSLWYSVPIPCGAAAGRDSQRGNERRVGGATAISVVPGYKLRWRAATRLKGSHSIAWLKFLPTLGTAYPLEVHMLALCWSD